MRSEGNPLYTEELLAAGLDGRGAPPQSLRDAFLGRIERLSEEAQRATRAVAVGRALDESTLSAVTGRRARTGPDGAARGGRRAGADRRRRRALLLPPRAAARGAVRRPAPRRARRVAPRAGEALEAGELGGEERELDRATMIASHYAAAGDQPAALRASVHAATLAGRAHAYGEVSELLERALELWPRVTEDARPQRSIMSICWRGRRGHTGSPVTGRARRSCSIARSKRWIPSARPQRYAALLGRLSRVQWSLNRGQVAIETAERALAMLAPEEGGRERALLLAWLARMRVLRGRYRDAIGDGEVALTAAIEAGDSLAECEVLNTLGMAQAMLGRVDEGVGQPAAGDRDRATERRCRQHLDRLLEPRRHAHPLRPHAGGARDRAGRRGADAAELHAQPRLDHVDDFRGRFQGRRLGAGSRQPRPAGVARGGDHVDVPSAARGRARARRGRRGRRRAPAWQSVDDARLRVIGAAVDRARSGSLLGELRRRQRDYDAARAAVENALERIELCTDDVMRIARVTAVGARVEADRAQRARDLGEKARAARRARPAAGSTSSGSRPRPQEGGPSSGPSSRRARRSWLAPGGAARASGPRR